MKLLKNTQHRPWPVPKAPWMMKQTWNEVLFAHWPVPIEQIRGQIPVGMEIDVFDGQAWLSVVFFRISGLRARWMPPMPFGSSFSQLNVRTYVTADQKPGVYFFSLDADNRLAVRCARLFFHLPYYDAQVEVTGGGSGISGYCRRRNSAQAGQTPMFAVNYAPVPDSAPFSAEQGTLDYWLTERYCLYSVTGKHIYRSNIHHLPWTLQRAQMDIKENTMLEQLGLGIALATTSTAGGLAHYSKRQDAMMWFCRKVR